MCNLFNFCRKATKPSKAERGQSMVEVAVGFLIIMVIMSGLFDLGRLYFVYVALEDGAGEAAVFLSVRPACEVATDDPDPTNADTSEQCGANYNAEDRAKLGGGRLVNWDTITVTSTVPTNFGAGDRVEVEVAYPFHFAMPLLPQITGVNPFTVRAAATQIIIEEGF